MRPVPLHLNKHLRKENWLKEEAKELGELREIPSPPPKGPEQDEGLDPETKKQRIHQPTLVDTLYVGSLVVVFKSW